MTRPRTTAVLFVVACALGTDAESKKLDHVALAKLLDAQIRKGLAAEKVPAAPRAGDAEFIRRVYLDLVGVIPKGEQAAAFLDSTDPAKRAKLIDRLLDDPRHAAFQEELWANVLAPWEGERRSKSALQSWLERGFRAGQPCNKLVVELLTVSGIVDDNGAVGTFTVNSEVDNLTNSVSHGFLGAQLDCARCHHHPYNDPKQEHYWAMAAFFGRTRTSAPGRIRRRA